MVVQWEEAGCQASIGKFLRAPRWRRRHSKMCHKSPSLQHTWGVAQEPRKIRRRKAGKMQGTADSGPRASEESPPHTLSHLPPSVFHIRLSTTLAYTGLSTTLVCGWHHQPLGSLWFCAHPSPSQGESPGKRTPPGGMMGNSMRDCKAIHSGKSNAYSTPRMRN